MVSRNLTIALETIRARNIPVRHAYPVTGRYELTVASASVEIEELNQGKDTTTVLVNLMAPRKVGAEACERRALDVCYDLSLKGAICRTEQCRYDGEQELFLIPIHAQFQGTE